MYWLASWQGRDLKIHLPMEVRMKARDVMVSPVVTVAAKGCIACRSTDRGDAPSEVETRGYVGGEAPWLEPMPPEVGARTFDVRVNGPIGDTSKNSLNEAGG